MRNEALNKVTVFENSLESKPQEKGGLCSSCKYASTCTYSKVPFRQVLQCEEFEGIVETKEKTSKPKMEVIKIEKSRKYLGLCKTCGKRDSCTFPKHESGVWHCQEYE